MILPTNSPAITGHYRRHSALRFIAVCAAAGAMLAAMSGCSNGHSNKPKAASPATIRAIRQIKLAADTAQHVSSLTASLVVRSVGKAGGDVSGTIQMRLKPSTLIAAQFLIPSANGKNIQLAEVLTRHAIYFKDPAFLTQTKLRKPWATVKISQLSGKNGMSLGSLLENMEGSNPLDQTRLFTSSTNVRRVGTRVHGVSTTEYTGTYNPKAAYTGLTPRLRKLIGPMLRSIGTHPVRFHIWIDADHMIKMADYTESVRGQTVTTTFLVTSVNQPVHIRVPKASQTAPLPNL